MRHQPFFAIQLSLVLDEFEWIKSSHSTALAVIKSRQHQFSEEKFRKAENRTRAGGDRRVNVTSLPCRAYGAINFIAFSYRSYSRPWGLLYSAWCFNYWSWSSELLQLPIRIPDQGRTRVRTRSSSRSSVGGLDLSTDGSVAELGTKDFCHSVVATLYFWAHLKNLGRGCGAVGKAVASNTRDPQI